MENNDNLMKLDDWIWRNRIQYRAFAREIGVSPSVLTNIAKRKQKPRLDIALLIYHYTNNEVSINDMLPEGMHEEILSRPSHKVFRDPRERK